MGTRHGPALARRHERGARRRARAALAHGAALRRRTALASRAAPGAPYRRSRPYPRGHRPAFGAGPALRPRSPQGAQRLSPGVPYVALNLRYVLVDVFTDTALQGNQLAVFTDASAIPEELLQPLALELG